MNMSISPSFKNFNDIITDSSKLFPTPKSYIGKTS